MLNRQLQKKFEERLIAQFQHNYKSQGREVNIRDFLQYLIRSQIIDYQLIRRYTILTEYKKILANEKQKHLTETKIFEVLGKRYAMHPNTVWNLVNQKSKLPLEDQEKRLQNLIKHAII